MTIFLLMIPIVHERFPHPLANQHFTQSTLSGLSFFPRVFILCHSFAGGPYSFVGWWGLHKIALDYSSCFCVIINIPSPPKCHGFGNKLYGHPICIWFILYCLALLVIPSCLYLIMANVIYKLPEETDVSSMIRLGWLVLC